MQHHLRSAGIVAALALLGVPAAADAALTPSVTAGATATPDVGWVQNVGACDRWVSTSGSDSAGDGTAEKPWRTPAKALERLVAGETGCVRAGTYTMPAEANAGHGGTAAQPIALQGAPGEAKPVLRASAEGETIDLEAGDRYWLLRDLAIDKAGLRGMSVRVLGTDHVALRGVDVRRGGEDAILIGPGTTDVDIEGGVLADNWEESGGVREDAHGVIIEGRNIARIAVRKVEASGNSGDGVQCSALDDTATYASNQPADILIEDNRFHDNAENAVDIKSCQRVSIRGSVSPQAPGRAADQKFFGFHPTTNSGTNTSNGTAIVLHYAAREVLIENTRIWAACDGIGIGRSDHDVRNVVVRRVLMFDMRGEADHGANCKGYGLRISRAQNVDAYQNSVDGTPRPALDLTGTDGATTTSSNVNVWNNVFSGRANRAVALKTARTPDLEMNHNVLHAATRPAQPFELNGSAVSLATWQGAGYDRASAVGDPLWVDDRLTNDFFTKPGSPARNRGIAVTGMTSCAGAPDAGFRESDC